MSIRELPLFDLNARPSSWNERMAPGEFAVHPSSFKAGTPACIVFDSLAEAEAYAREQIVQQPSLRCRIYDHQGFVGAPPVEVAGSAYQGDRDLSPRVRRWLGSALFFGGLGLVLLDWSTDFHLSWPALVGSRLLIPGLLLLLTEGLILLHAKQKAVEAKRRSSL